MASNNRRISYYKGLWAEIVGLIYLFFKNYKILEWRYRSPMGEIDLIAKRANKIVFFEIKTRRSVHDGLEAITAKNRNRIENAAKIFIAQNSCYQSLDMRFDAIVMVLKYGVIPVKIQHLDNAWLCRA